LVRGELGYVDWCLQVVEAGHCSCAGCCGHLADGVCLACGCTHQIVEATRFHPRLPVWIPTFEAGRCADADRRRAEERREHDRQRRTQGLAEDLGDPQR
jgi:hypothetical protein